MLFQYIGDGNESPQSCEVYGHVFALNGEPVDVKDQQTISKLVGNKTFKHEPPALIAPAVQEIITEAVESLASVAVALPTPAEVAAMAETPVQVIQPRKVLGRR